jgi:hypothetical protein
VAISREAVSWGFRLILGREPESEEGILAHMRLDDETELIEVLLRSGEFRNSKRFDKLIQLREGVTAERSTPWPYQSTSKLRMALFGNCQVVGVGRLLQAMSGDISVQTFETTPTMLDRLQRGDLDIAKTLRSADLVFVQYLGQVISIIQERFPKHAHRLRQFPPVAYAGFHPDCVYVRSGSGHLSGSMGEYHSAIAFWAWRHGLDVRHAVDLFRPEVFEALGYDSYHQAAYNSLIEIGRDTSMPMAPHLDTWQRHGCWMHTINHPKLMVLADVASAMLVREGIEPIREAAQWVEDPLLNWPVWPVYPGLAEKVGLQGSYVFKIDSGFCPPQRPVLTMDLESFVEASYNTYKRSDRTRLSCPRVDTPPYSQLPSFVREQPSRLQVLARALVRVATPTAQPTASRHPYQALPDFAYWRRSVERVAAELIDPVIGPKFAVTISDRVATAGSCFAQHIARTLQREGFNYFVADDDQGLTAEQRQRRGYGVFSARYGNVYTTRQLVQSVHGCARMGALSIHSGPRWNLMDMQARRPWKRRPRHTWLMYAACLPNWMCSCSRSVLPKPGAYVPMARSTPCAQVWWPAAMTSRPTSSSTSESPRSRPICAASWHVCAR